MFYSRMSLVAKRSLNFVSHQNEMVGKSLSIIFILKDVNNKYILGF